MPTPVHDAPDARPDPHRDEPAPGSPAERRRTHRRGWIVLLIGIWNLWVWGTRLRNVITDDQANTSAFDLVHGSLFGVSSVLAGVLCVIGYRMIRQARP